MPATDPELDSVRAELSESLVDLEYIRQHTQPHIHLRSEVTATWDAALARLRRARDGLYRRAHRE